MPNARTVVLNPNQMLIKAQIARPSHHEPAGVDAIADDAVHELRYAVHQTVQREEQPKLRFCDAERRFHDGHRHAQVLAHEIEQRVADERRDQNSPLPVGKIAVARTSRQVARLHRHRMA